MSNYKQDNIPWLCSKCGTKLEEVKVKVKYITGNIEVELLKCPKCNMVLITEDLALGKMLEVEKNLEDK